MRVDSILDLLRRRDEAPVPVPYEKASDPTWNDKAAGTWGGQMRPTGQGWQTLVAEGECPRCGHGFSATLSEAVLVHVAEATASLVFGEDVQVAEFTFICQCDAKHEGRPVDESGCGAAWNLKTFWSPTTDKPAPVMFLAGTPVDWEDRRSAEVKRDLNETELQRVREAGDKWKTGLSLLLGLIATVSVVKGRDSIETLSVDTQHGIIVMLAAGLLAAAAGALFAMRAANGPLEPQTLQNRSLDELRSEEVRSSLRTIRQARSLTVISLVIVALAVGIAWWSEEPTPGRISVEQQDSSTTLCGEFIDADANQIRIETSPGTTIPVALANVKRVSFRQKC